MILFEIILRRLLHDDGKGVAESLNETVCVNDKCDGLIVSTLSKNVTH